MYKRQDYDSFFEDLGFTKEAVSNGDVRIIKSNSRYITISVSYTHLKAGYNILLGIDNDAKALETFELNHKGSKSICGDRCV